MSRVCVVVLDDEDPDVSFSFKPPLLKAIFSVDPDDVRSLIFKKEDVNVQDNEKRTPLHAAAYLGDAEIIELLILSGRFS
ncbi:hypothetical protein AMECASPLE_035189 [Ameca splendens]|uniref:Uncharacterized protein n=1 Tax=Ameca splendens TaxID=208324 RepID=A0ABV0YUG1_9TELE